MKQVFLLALVLVFATGTTVVAQSTEKPDPWAGVRFLIGTWDAKTTGGSAKAQGTGTYSFRLELRDHVLARHSEESTCKGPEDFNCEHGDLLYLYPEGPTQALRAIYFDNEGHVIHYSVTVPKTGSVVLLSNGDGPGPQFRLSYELTGDGIAGRFQIRIPGQEEFSTYLEWSGGKKGETVQLIDVSV